MSPKDRWPTIETLSAVRNGDLPTSIKNLEQQPAITHRRLPKNGTGWQCILNILFPPNSLADGFVDTMDSRGVWCPKGISFCEIGTLFRNLPSLEGILDLKLFQVGRLKPLLLDFFQVRVPAV